MGDVRSGAARVNTSALKKIVEFFWLPIEPSGNDLPKEGAACHLVYCFRTQNQAAHLDRVEALVTANPRLQLHVVDSL